MSLPSYSRCVECPVGLIGPADRHFNVLRADHVDILNGAGSSDRNSFHILDIGVPYLRHGHAYRVVHSSNPRGYNGDMGHGKRSADEKEQKALQLQNYVSSSLNHVSSFFWAQPDFVGISHDISITDCKKACLLYSSFFRLPSVFFPNIQRSCDGNRSKPETDQIGIDSRCYKRKGGSEKQQPYKEEKVYEKETFNCK